MVFSSDIFLLYFLPIFLLVYFLTPRKVRNYVLLLFSIVFYAYGSPDFVLILLGTTIINFFLVRWMDKQPDKSISKKIICGVSVALSLGLLLYFKYANFFMDNLNAILGFINRPKIPWMKVALPIGISFFSFQSITYTVDTYRKVNKPMTKLSDYVVYIIMFPQLIAGPIIRYCDIADQIRHRRAFFEDRMYGFYRFVLGLSKKVLIADIIGQQVDIALAGDIALIDSSTAWITIFAYTFQLYFDFAGYSDMAIGLGRMLGFKFPENFDNPYVAQSISEFWRRWHQTFSVFMKHYLYFPLGGSRVKTKRRHLFNLWFVFLVSGLWHGASWNFVVYGAIQGFFIIMDKMFLVKFMNKLGKIPSVICTFLVIVLARVFFRIEDISLAWTFMTRLFAFDFAPVSWAGNEQYFTTIFVAAFFSFITLFKFGLKLQDKVYFSKLNKGEHILFWIISIILFIFCLASLNATGFSPFIYFRF